jgi:hypothetical protein
MATTTPNFGWPVPTSTDLVKDGATAIEALGDGIDTSLVDLKGGLTGQVLAKTTNTDMDFTWVTTDDANAIQNAIVNAKGDIIGASANDVPAITSVGANGEMLVADSTTTTGLRYQGSIAGGKNAVINGGFDIWQRGTSITIGSDGAAFSADRFKGSYTGTGINVVATQESDSPNAQTKFSLKLTQTGGNATSLTTYAVRTFIEQNTILPLLGRACVASFWYKSSVTGTHAMRINGTENTSGTNQTATFTVSAANTWEFKTVAVTAFSAITTATATVTDRGAFIDLGPASQSNGQTSFASGAYFQIAQLQLEIGSVATSFSRSGGTIQGELAACQRYYFRTTTGTNNQLIGAGIATTATTASVYVVPPVTMRVAPTSVDAANLATSDLTAFTNAVTAPTTIAFSTVNNVRIDLAGGSGMTAKTPIVLQTNGTAGYLGLSAEL